LEELQKARDKKQDIKTMNDEVLTNYQIGKYGKADIIDLFLCFSLPCYPRKIRDRFKASVSNISKEKRNSLNYEQVKRTIDSWQEEDKYYTK
jgi:hypothetical protein